MAVMTLAMVLFCHKLNRPLAAGLMLFAMLTHFSSMLLVGVFLCSRVMRLNRLLTVVSYQIVAVTVGWHVYTLRQASCVGQDAALPSRLPVGDQRPDDVDEIASESAARVALQTAGFNAHANGNGALELADAAAIERPDEIATRLVNAGCAPTLLHVEQEDLEQYFLRLVGVESRGAQ